MSVFPYTGQAKITSGYADSVIIGSITPASGRFSSLESTVLTGTQPLIISSTTEVANLRSATTSALATSGLSVNISAAAPPAVGSVLRATSATTATWQVPSSGRSYVLSTSKNNVATTGFVPFAYFPWSNSQHGSLSSGKVIFRATVTDRLLDIQLYDATNLVVLGSLSNVSSTGTYSFNISNPAGDAEVQLRAKKSAVAGVSPFLLGATLEF